MVNNYDFHSQYQPIPNWAIDQIYQTLTPIITPTDEGYCYHIENEDEEQIAEDCGYTTEEAAEEAADEARFYIAEQIAREDEE